jgi:hypothetical protein
MWRVISGEVIERLTGCRERSNNWSTSLYTLQDPQPTASTAYRIHGSQSLHQQVQHSTASVPTGFIAHRINSPPPPFIASRIRNQHSQPKDLQAIGSTASGIRCQQGPQTTEFTANKIQSQQHPQPTASEANKIHSPHHPLPTGSAANKIYRRPLPYPTGSTANRVHSQRNPSTGTAA